MKLVPSKTFVRDARRFLKKNPKFEESVKLTLKLMEDDVFNPKLKTHRLKGSLKNSLSCSVAYDLRIVFEFIDQEGEMTILLQTLGTHDEVY